MSRRGHATSEDLFDAETALRCAARKYFLNETADNRKALRAAARYYATLADGIDATAVSDDFASEGSAR